MSHVIVVTYPDEARAEAVMKELREFHSQNLLDLEDAAYVTKNAGGRVMLYEAVARGSKTDPVSRLLWGDLAGTLMMVPEPTATVDNPTPALQELLWEHGLDDYFVASFIDQMAPGSSAIMILVRHSAPESVVLELSKFGGNVLCTTLPRKKEAQLEQMCMQGPSRATWTLRKGMAVQARDGDAGKVSDIICEPVTGLQSHFVLESGPLFDRQDVILPTAAIDWVAGNTAHLKLSKAAVANLPSSSARERGGWAGGNPESVDLVVRLFDDTASAGKALKVLDDAVWAGTIDIYNAAVITKDRDGHVRISQRRDRNVRLSAMFGMLAGALMGLVAGGPAGVAAGAAAAGAIGAGEAALIEAGFPRETLQNVQTHTTPGTSALVVAIERVWVKNLDETLNQFGGGVVRQTLSDAMVESMVRTQAVHDRRECDPARSLVCDGRPVDESERGRSR